MKLQIISRNNRNKPVDKEVLFDEVWVMPRTRRKGASESAGFLTVEIMLAFSLMILFTISTFTLLSSMQKLKQWSLSELDKLKDSVHKIDQIIDGDFTNLSQAEVSDYGNDTKIIYIDPISVTHSDYSNSWGRNSCSPRLSFEKSKVQYFSQGVDIGSGNVSTDIEVRNGVVYLTADSSVSSKKDFFVIDSKNPAVPTIISSLNTGPGLSAIEVAGPYAFVSQASSQNQLQIIDMHNRNTPLVISQLKLPLPTASTTAPFAISIFYSKGFIYLGTVKWSGAEFSIIDVRDPYRPVTVGIFETNTLVNDIYVRENIAYLATADIKQMTVLDVSDKSNPHLIGLFSPSGFQVQEGKTLEYFEGGLLFGRNGGGFNVTTNHEVFLFATNTDISKYISKDIPGGVYGILLRPPSLFLLTHSLLHEFQIWDPALESKIDEVSLGVEPLKMLCDSSNIFFATGDSRGFSVLKLNQI